MPYQKRERLDQSSFGFKRENHCTKTENFWACDWTDFNLEIKAGENIVFIVHSNISDKDYDWKQWNSVKKENWEGQLNQTVWFLCKCKLVLLHF